MAEAVRLLLEKFDELDAATDNSAAAGEVTGTTGQGPIDPTFLIAASDARTELQDVADYVCTGTNDDETVDQAIADMGSTPYGLGRFVFTAGAFNFNDDLDFSGVPSCIVEGMGRESTYFIFDNITATELVKMGDHSLIQHLTIQETTE